VEFRPLPDLTQSYVEYVTVEKHLDQQTYARALIIAKDTVEVHPAEDKRFSQRLITF
jgi:hypothetical protein